MLKAFLIGNLTKDPELRSTKDGTAVCSFTVACNRRKKGAQAGQEADFVRVTTWRNTAESCRQYLVKGKKVGITGTLELESYTANDGTTRYQLAVQADDVEFLTPKSDTAPAAPAVPQGFVQVDDDDELPF